MFGLAYVELFMFCEAYPKILWFLIFTAVLEQMIESKYNSIFYLLSSYGI